MLHVESTARENAVRAVVGLHDGSLECFNDHLAGYQEGEDFFEHVEGIVGNGCGSPRILNKTDEQIAELRNHLGYPAKPTGSNTWYTSGIRTGDTATIAVTTVGDGRASVGHESAMESLAVCWTIVVDIPGRTAEAVNDDGDCHEWALLPNTSVMPWDEVRQEYEQLD